MYNQYPYGAFNPGTFTSATPGMSTNPGGLGGLLGLGKKAFSWDGFLTNAQKTLNVVNQAMPIYNQVKPMFRNMGTVFKVIGELNKNGTSTSVNNTNNTNSNSANNSNNSNSPQFFA